jgi:hypothetical protein
MDKVKIFLGGGVELLEGNVAKKGYRKTVVDPVISSLNSLESTDRTYIVKTFKDMTHDVSKDALQDFYMEFIQNKADIAIFILDGELGDHTKNELKVARDISIKKGHPTIFLYGKDLKDDSQIVKYISEIDQYYQHFYTEVGLADLIRNDLEHWKRQSRISDYIKRILFSLLFIGLIILVYHYIDIQLQHGKTTNENTIPKEQIKSELSESGMVTFTSSNAIKSIKYSSEKVSDWSKVVKFINPGDTLYAINTCTIYFAGFDGNNSFVVSDSIHFSLENYIETLILSNTEDSREKLITMTIPDAKYYIDGEMEDYIYIVSKYLREEIQNGYKIERLSLRDSQQENLSTELSIPLIKEIIFSRDSTKATLH